MAAPIFEQDDIFSRYEFNPATDRIHRAGPGQGLVLRARRRSDGKRVIIKAYHDPARPVENWTSIEEAELGYHRELKFLRIAEKDKRPDIPVLVEHGIGGPLGQPVSVFEEIEGRSLDDIVQNETLRTRDIVDIATSIADALTYAHTVVAKPIVHRDFNPDQVMVRPDGSIVVIDWATAKAKSGGTKFGTQFSTEYFTAPEVEKGLPSGPNADVYSLGRSIQYMLLGPERFKDLDGNPQAKDFVNINAPSRLIASLERATQQRPEKRHNTMREFRDELAAAFAPVRIAYDIVQTRDYELRRLEPKKLPVLEKNPPIACASGNSLREILQSHRGETVHAAPREVANAHIWLTQYETLQAVAETNPVMKRRLEGDTFVEMLEELASEREAATKGFLNRKRFDREWRDEYNERVEALAAILDQDVYKGFAVWGLKDLWHSIVRRYDARRDGSYNDQAEKNFESGVNVMLTSLMTAGTLGSIGPVAHYLTWPGFFLGTTGALLTTYSGSKFLHERANRSGAFESAKALDAQVERTLAYKALHDRAESGDEEAKKAAETRALEGRPFLAYTYSWGNEGDSMIGRIRAIDGKTTYALKTGQINEFESEEVRRRETTALVKRALQDDEPYAHAIAHMLEGEDLASEFKERMGHTKEFLRDNPEERTQNRTLNKELSSIISGAYLNTNNILPDMRVGTYVGAAVGAAGSALAARYIYPGLITEIGSALWIGGATGAAGLLGRMIGGEGWSSEWSLQSEHEKITYVQRWLRNYTRIGEDTPKKLDAADEGTTTLQLMPPSQP